MAYLHNNKDQFQDAIELAYEQTGIMAQAIEKDYYVTMLLRLLSEKMPYIVFKGGTSLRKVFIYVNYFSSIFFYCCFTFSQYQLFRLRFFG